MEKTSFSFLRQDLLSGAVVFLVALPLCLGIALASNAPLISGVISGIIGGIVVGLMSRSHISVSGPAAGLTAIVAYQIISLGSLQAFFLAVLLAGLFQIILGLLNMGFLSSFFPSSVIKGLLFSIGMILILKQLPHLFGLDSDFLGEMSFFQPNNETTLSDLWNIFFNFHYGAAFVGLLSLCFLVIWSKVPTLENLLLPSQLVVVVLATLATFLFGENSAWFIGSEHRVLVPVINSFAEAKGIITFPDFAFLTNPSVYLAALTLCTVASLETLLNLEAAYKIDPQKKVIYPNQELLSQGVGNMICGFLGGLPITSVIIRSSVNIEAKAKTKASAVFHGFFLFFSVLLFPQVLNYIPLSALAAILIIAGFHMASVKVARKMWEEGYSQFVPFATTVVAIMFTDLLQGIVIGLVCSAFFILYKHFKIPVEITLEKRFNQEHCRLSFKELVSFLNLASVRKALNEMQDGTKVIFDGTKSYYIDEDIIELLREFSRDRAVRKNIQVSFVGFENYGFSGPEELQEHVCQEIQKKTSPEQVLELLKSGNQRFAQGSVLTKNWDKQIQGTSKGQFPLAAVLSCIDSRTPAELIFDLNIGDIFSVRMAGNVVSQRVLGSLEFACVVAKAKLIVVMGHTSCGAISATAELLKNKQSAQEAFGCPNLDYISSDIKNALMDHGLQDIPEQHKDMVNNYNDQLALANISYGVKKIKENHALGALLKSGEIDIVGAIYNIATGKVDFLEETSKNKEHKIFRGNKQVNLSGRQGGLTEKAL